MRNDTMAVRQYYLRRLQEEPQKVVDRVFSKNYRVVSTFDKTMYWVMLIVAIIGNMLVSIVLVPMLMVLTNIGLLLVIVTVAVTFGFLFSRLLIDIETLNPNSYIIGEIFLPLQALINVYFITLLANEVSLSIRLSTWHNPLIIGIIYTSAFVAPYLFFKLPVMRQKFGWPALH